MRYVFLLLAILFAGPAFAQGWAPYTNARTGASADVPPNYTALGPEDPSGKGQTFGNAQRNSLVTIYGESIPGGNFDAFIDRLIQDLKNYEGWAVQGKRVTPDWAELDASSGRTMMRVRVVTSCDGRTAAIAKYQGGPNNNLVSHLFRSLKSGTAPACN